MGSFVFRWPHAATEVYVTGTFDDWGKTVKLEKTESGVFEKDVELKDAETKIFYKFVVDDTWTTDHSAPQEQDESGNTNNVLLPAEIKKTVPPTTTAVAEEPSTSLVQQTEQPEPISPSLLETAGAAAIMSGVTAESTTAQLAADVPKESSIPEPTPASEKNVFPGAFPETPALDLNKQIGIDPIPASEGAGNPVKLAPGEKIPENIHQNTIDSTVTTDKESYEKAGSAPFEGAALGAGAATAGASAFEVPAQSKNLIPESSLPIGNETAAADTTDIGPTVQSAAPTSTTAELAAAVPKEPRGEAIVEDEKPSATLSGPAPAVPEVVKESLAEAHAEPEAAASKEAVEEKKEVEAELLKEIKTEQSSGEPAPTVAAATSATAPAPTASEPVAPVEEKKADTLPIPQASKGGAISEPVSPGTTTPAATTNGDAPATSAAKQEPVKEKKKKNRLSAFIGKLKGKKSS